MTPGQTKQRLELLDPGILADALIQLADKNQESKMLVDRLISTGKEAISLFKRKISGLKRRRRFLTRSESRGLSSELEELLLLLDGDEVPADGALKCLLTFFEADQFVFNMADDSDGNMGHVFRSTATDLFIKKATEYGNQTVLLGWTKKLISGNDYSSRDEIVSRSGEYLDEASMRKLFSHFKNKYDEKKSEEADETYGKSYNSKIVLKETARQLKDPDLFQQVCLYGREKLYEHERIDIAEVFYEAGQPEVALKKLRELDEIPANQINEHRKLLLKIHSSLGNDEAMTTIHSDYFFQYPSLLTYQDVIELVDKKEADEILNQCLKRIHQEKHLCVSSILFLFELEQFESADAYLLKRKNQIDGNHYYDFPKIAAVFVKHSHDLSATFIYRALLLSILARASTKSYPHGARYLSKLSEISKNIDDWMGASDHDEFFRTMQMNHKRKTSFWKRVSELG